MCDDQQLLFQVFPIHPPVKEDPWKIEFQEDCGYRFQLSKGVYSVYKNDQDLAENKPINYEVSEVYRTTATEILFSVCGPGHLRVGHAAAVRDDCRRTSQEFLFPAVGVSAVKVQTSHSPQ